MLLLFCFLYEGVGGWRANEGTPIKDSKVDRRKRRKYTIQFACVTTHICTHTHSDTHTHTQSKRRNEKKRRKKINQR